MKDPVRNVAASVRQRLLDQQRREGGDYGQLAVRYASERLLYRLGAGTHADRFVLKGAMLFVTWSTQPHRPTRDLDLLGFGDPSAQRLADVFADICAMAITPEDGLVWDARPLSVAPIREDLEYGGQRVQLLAHLHGMRIPLQIDVGFGDAITPEATHPAWPCLLGFPTPAIRAYPPETVISEKTHAMTVLGLANTRMKDYFDLLWLARNRVFDRDILAAAIAATFAMRKTAVPMEMPSGLSDGFAADATKQLQWNAFLRKNKLEAPPLPVVVAELRAVFWPSMERAGQK